MNLSRTAALSTLALALARKAIAFTMRFLRDQPASDNERRVFVHLNGLVESVIAQALNRTFTPTPLRAVR